MAGTTATIKGLKARFLLIVHTLHCKGGDSSGGGARGTWNGMGRPGVYGADSLSPN
ncbi:hypothetical protein [Aestuariivirga sp.]|uniref:hypothetical protein n=1 Tax=Aestuariivirga sp. TaxID=2650926 RepID=UPI0030160CF3